MHSGPFATGRAHEASTGNTRPQRPVCRVSSCIPLSSVQLQMLSTRAGKPVCAPPRLSEAFLRSSVGISALSHPFKKYCERFISLCLSPSGDLWCAVIGFGFVPPCCTSSSSTLQIFRSASHLSRLLCLPVYLSGHFP